MAAIGFQIYKKSVITEFFPLFKPPLRLCPPFPSLPFAPPSLPFAPASGYRHATFCLKFCVTVPLSGVLVAFRAPSRTKTPSKLRDAPFFVLRALSLPSAPISVLRFRFRVGYRHATFCPKFCVTDYLQIVMLNEVKHLYADSSLMNAQNDRVPLSNRRSC